MKKRSISTSWPIKSNLMTKYSCSAILMSWRLTRISKKQRQYSKDQLKKCLLPPIKGILNSQNSMKESALSKPIKKEYKKHKSVSAIRLNPLLQKIKSEEILLKLMQESQKCVSLISLTSVKLKLNARKQCKRDYKQISLAWTSNCRSLTIWCGVMISNRLVVNYSRSINGSSKTGSNTNLKSWIQRVNIWLRSSSTRNLCKFFRNCINSRVASWKSSICSLFAALRWIKWPAVRSILKSISRAKWMGWTVAKR